MNFLKNLSILSLFLCSNINNLNAAAAREPQEQCYFYQELLDTVQENTPLPTTVCQNIIMPYLDGHYKFQPLKMTWNTRVPSHFLGSFVQQLEDKRILAVAKTGEMALLNQQNGVVLQNFQLQQPINIRHVASLGDNRFVAACRDGNLHVTTLDDEIHTQVIPSGHKKIAGLVCAMARAQKELLVGGDAGLSVFDAQTWKSTKPFDCHQVTSMALLPDKEKVAFNATSKEQPNSHGTIHIYDAMTQTVRSLNINVDRERGIVGVCGRRLMVMHEPGDDYYLHHIINFYDPENGSSKPLGAQHSLKTCVNSSVALPGAAAILMGIPLFPSVADDRQKKHRGGCVAIVNENKLQRLSKPNVFSMAALSRGSLAITFTDSPNDAQIALWQPMSTQEAQEKKHQEKEIALKARTKKVVAGASFFFGLAALMKFKN